MLIEGVDELSLYLLFIIIIFYRVFISMDFRHGNGWSGSAGVLPSIVAPAPFRP